MQWLTGHWGTTWAMAVKAILLYATALAGLRIGTRRTIAQMSMFDFVTAVAMGAVIGRTVTSRATSYAEGAVAVITLIVAHRLVSLIRYSPTFTRITDHRIRILVTHGRIRRRQLWICGLTEQDLRSALRERGFTSLGDVRLVLYESSGALTVLPDDGRSGGLVDDAVASAIDPPCGQDR